MSTALNGHAIDAVRHTETVPVRLTPEQLKELKMRNARESPATKLAAFARSLLVGLAPPAPPPAPSAELAELRQQVAALSEQVKLCTVLLLNALQQEHDSQVVDQLYTDYVSEPMAAASVPKGGAA